MTQWLSALPFLKQGLTIVSVLTVIGMTISPLVLALTGSIDAMPSPPPSGDKGGLREWIKNTFRAIRQALAKLASKEGAVIPGIIGSILSLLLNLSKTAGWLAKNW